MTQQPALDFNPRSDTSRLAAEGNRPRRPLDRDRARRALWAAGPRGLTDFELASAMSIDGHGHIEQTSAGRRRLDLVRSGHVVRRIQVDGVTPDTRPSPTGASASVWIAIEYDPFDPRYD